jgi:transcriptional regulator with XRE-family HTH domain
MNVREYIINNPNQDEKTFGQFLRQRREELGFTVRGFAKDIDIMPSYLSDVEKGNRHAPANRLEIIRIKLGIPEEERQLFEDMASATRGNGCPDINPYLDKKEIARVALRKARDKDISDEKWEEILKIIDTP